jgi:OOP family OmpA-OmpF porin
LTYFSNSFGQNQFTYDFNSGLSPIEKGGPSLKAIGQAGKLVRELVPGSGVKGVPEIYRTVYQFKTNSGLQFDNTLTNGFLNKNFTIELYFKMDTLGSWKRVIDFKNRKSDYGCYIYDGKLNFYDFAVGEKVPIRPGQYIHYVISRDVETKQIKMYINGLEKIEFTDPGKEAQLDMDQVLNFFQDDLVANHEASSGSVALIRLYDRVMTPVFIRRSFQTLTKLKPEVPKKEEPVEEPSQIVTKTPPPPSTNLVKVSGKIYDANSLAGLPASIRIHQISTDSLLFNTKTENGFYQFLLQPYQSYKISVDAMGFQSKTIAVQTQNRNQEIKSLINLTRESYELPLMNIYFQQSKEELDDLARKSLDSIANYFQMRPDLKMVIKGHTDNQGDFNKNLELSNQRVEMVKSYLIGRGVGMERISGSGYGPARPAQRNISEQLRKNNRRVEVWAEPIKR